MKKGVLQTILSLLLVTVLLITVIFPVNVFAAQIGQFNVNFQMDGSTLKVTLIPTVSSAEAYNIWYTNVENPTQLSQAVAGYPIGSKNSQGNYVIDIPNVQLGPNGLIYLFLSTNIGDTGWVAFNVFGGGSHPGTGPDQDVHGNIGQFKASLKLNNTTLTVTLIPDVPGAEAYNIWYTNVENPTHLSQAVAGYLIGSKNSQGNYVIDIPDVQLGPNGLIHLFLSTNAGDTGWVAFNVYGGSDPGDPGTEPGPQPGPGGDVVYVGSGGYTLVPYGTQDYGGEIRERSYELQWLPVGANRRSTENFTGPVPTNDWGTTLIWGTMWGGYDQKYSEPLYAIPTIFKAHAGGVNICYPPRMVINNGNEILKHYEEAYVDISVGGVGFSAVDARVDKVTDWSYDFVLNNASKTQSIKATILHGNPFGYFYFNNVTPYITLPRGLPAWIVSGDANSNVLLIKTMDNADEDYNFYGIFAPQGTTWTIDGNQGSITGLRANMPPGRNYISIAPLPYNVSFGQTEDMTVLNSMLNTFRKYAYNFVTDTRISYSYNENTRTITTTFNITTGNKPESTASGTIIALFPHHYRNETVHNYLGYSYHNTIRGELKLIAGTSFTSTEKFYGVLPVMPNWNFTEAEKAQMRAYLDELINTDSFINPSNPSAGLTVALDTYWTGKELNRLVNALTVAEQIGYAHAANILYNTIKGELENWVTPTDSNGNFKNDKFFYYNSDVGSLIGYPSGFGSDTQLNDHHFHYGYFINAAAQIALREPAWAQQWGGMVEMLINDIACNDRNSTMFPFLRAMDPYEGHSWASGHAQFGDGNNQESSSEAMHAWAGIIMWGEATGNRNIRELGIYLYSTEKSAIHEYWYDQYNEVFDPVFNHEAVGMVWGGKYSFATWWSPNPIEVYGINFLPTTGGSFYLAEFKNKISRVYNATYAEGEATNYGGTGNSTIWKDIMVKYLALSDPSRARSEWRADLAPEAGESKAFTYYWINSLDKNGTLDTSTYATNSPLSVVLVKNGVKTYVVYNPSNTAKEIVFNNGVRIQAAPGTVTVAR